MRVSKLDTSIFFSQLVLDFLLILRTVKNFIFQKMVIFVNFGHFLKKLEKA